MKKLILGICLAAMAGCDRPAASAGATFGAKAGTVVTTKPGAVAGAEMGAQLGADAGKK